MQKKTFLVLSFLAFSSFRAYALDQLVYCGNLFDPVKGKWQKNQVLHLRDGKVLALNPKETPKGAEVLEFKTSYVIPGLIDTHTHLFLNDLSLSRDFAKGTSEFITKTSLNERQKLGVSRGESLLKAGFTSVRDLGNDGGSDIRKLETIKTPRFFSSGKGFVPKLGQLPADVSSDILKQEYSLLSGAPSDGLKEFEDAKFDVLKLYADEDPNPAVTPLPMLRSWVDYGKKKGFKVAVHAIFQSAIENTLKTNADTLEHGNEITSAQLTSLASKKMIFVPSNANALLVDHSEKLKLQGVKEQFDQYCRNVRNAVDLRVKIAFGSDNYFSLDDVSFGEFTMKALLRSHRCGMKASEILHSATIMAAKALGKEKILGDLRPGMFGDFIVLERDPLKNIQELLGAKKVFKSGIEVR